MSEEVKEMGKPSARLTKISKGGRVWITRKYPESGIAKLQGHIDMRLYVNDQIRTDKITFAAIEFFTGGAIGINKDTEIEIVKLNEVKQLNVPFKDKFLNNLGFGKKNDPLQIRTAGGVMGVKG
jgi:hypothetical protein